MMLLAPYKYLETALRGISAVNSGVNEQFYRGIAHSRAGFPYCSISLNSGGQTNSAIRFHEGDTLWTVKFVGLKDQHATQMRTWAGLVFDEIHETIPGLVDDCYIFLVTHETVVDYDERDGDTVYLHTGGNYRVQLTK